MTRYDLADAVISALKEHGGEASIVEVARWIWRNFERELMKSGDLFYTWQYDMRWQANLLRNAGVLKESKIVPRGKWALR